MASPRVLVLTTIPETLAAFLARQLRQLSEAGFEIHVVSSPGAALDALDLAPGTPRYGIRMERQPSPLRDAESLARLTELMLRIQPGIVHAHTPKAGLLGMAAAALARVPVRLYTVHGLPLITRTGFRRKLLQAAERMSTTLSTQTYAVSQSVRRAMIDLDLSSRVTVLGDGSCAGVDTERFAPAPGLRAAARARWKITPDALAVTFIGRLARDKGIAVLADAWDQVKREVPSAELILAGEPDTSDPVPEKALQSLRGAPSVRWLRSVPHDKVPELYAATDLAVLPTYREGLSQLTLEAGACGVPLVASDATGLDAVRSGQTGLLVPPGRPDALAGALTKLALDPDLRGWMGQQARDHIVRHYSARRVDALWMAEYRRLAAEIVPHGRLIAERP